MALVDEAQLSSIKEKRRQLEEENKIGVHTRELSVHVDNFKGNSMFDLNNTNNDNESNDVNMEDSAQKTNNTSNNYNNYNKMHSHRPNNKKILVEESNAKQQALDAINKLFKNGLNSSNSVVDDKQTRNNIIYINSVPENMKSSNDTHQSQLTYNKGLSRQANHTLKRYLIRV